MSIISITLKNFRSFRKVQDLKILIFVNLGQVIWDGGHHYKYIFDKINKANFLQSIRGTPTALLPDVFFRYQYAFCGSIDEQSIGRQYLVLSPDRKLFSDKLVGIARLTNRIYNFPRDFWQSSDPLSLSLLQNRAYAQVTLLAEHFRCLRCPSHYINYGELF